MMSLSNMLLLWQQSEFTRAADNVSLETSKAILELGQSAMGGFKEIGIGIASIFILFVIFYYVTAILDGGKFQTKMLWPLALYVIICNFNLVAQPTIGFTTALQAGCINVCNGFQASALAKASNGLFTADECKNMTLAEIFIAKRNKENPPPKASEELEPDPPVVLEQHSGYDTNGHYTETVVTEKPVEEKGTPLNRIKRAIVDAFNKIKENIQMSFWKGESAIKYGLPGAAAILLQWITTILGIALKGLGSVMTGIIIAFGPITWAFAVFPGNNKVIGSWFIRLCQFSLYGPLVALINAFCSALLLSFSGGAGGSGSFFAILSLLVCNIVALTSIPSIASMIIEGASGSVSLSQGMQTAGAAASAVGGAAMAPVKGGWNMNKELWNLRSMKTQTGEESRDSNMMHALNSIAKSLDPNYSPADGGAGGGEISGLNSANTQDS